MGKKRSKSQVKKFEKVTAGNTQGSSATAFIGPLSPPPRITPSKMKMTNELREQTREWYDVEAGNFLIKIDYVAQGAIVEKSDDLVEWNNSMKKIKEELASIGEAAAIVVRSSGGAEDAELLAYKKAQDLAMIQQFDKLTQFAAKNGYKGRGWHKFFVRRMAEIKEQTDESGNTTSLDSFLYQQCFSKIGLNEDLAGDEGSESDHENASSDDDMPLLADPRLPMKPEVSTSASATNTFKITTGAAKPSTAAVKDPASKQEPKANKIGKHEQARIAKAFFKSISRVELEDTSDISEGEMPVLEVMRPKGKGNKNLNLSAVQAAITVLNEKQQKSGDDDEKRKNAVLALADATNRILKPQSPKLTALDANGGDNGGDIEMPMLEDALGEDIVIPPMVQKVLTSTPITDIPKKKQADTPSAPTATTTTATTTTATTTTTPPAKKDASVPATTPKPKVIHGCGKPNNPITTTAKSHGSKGKGNKANTGNQKPATSTTGTPWWATYLTGATDVMNTRDNLFTPEAIIESTPSITTDNIDKEGKQAAVSPAISDAYKYRPTDFVNADVGCRECRMTFAEAKGIQDNFYAADRLEVKEMPFRGRYW